MDTDPQRAPLLTRIDQPWIGLLVLGIFIFVSSVVALIVLCCFWRRHQQRTRMSNESFILSNKPTGRPSYERQDVEAYVSSITGHRLPACLTSLEDIPRVHHFYETTNKAYF